MRPIDVTAPPSFAAKARWVIQSFLDASAADASAEPVRYPSSALAGSEAAVTWFAEAGGRPPASAGDGLIDFGDGVEDIVASAFWHLSRWEEREGSPRDRHGRFTAAFSATDPERPAVDALLRRFQDATGLPPRSGFTVALTHDIDTPWRWSGRAALRAAAAQGKAALRERRASDVLAEAAGLAAVPVHRLRGTDPNWTFERMRKIERRHGGRSTHFLMAGQAHRLDGVDAAAYDRLRGRIVRVVAEGGDEVGLHPSYTTSDDPHRLAAEKHLLEGLTGGPVASVRFHFLRHDTHRTLPALPRLGFRLDSSQGYPDRPGLRAGFSHPYRPFDLAADRPVNLIELPLAVMDATLQDAHYLGLSPGAGLARATAVLEQVARSGGAVAILWHNNRFSRTYGRGWDRCYDRLLGWISDRGGRLCAAEDVLAERF